MALLKKPLDLYQELDLLIGGWLLHWVFQYAARSEEVLNHRVSLVYARPDAVTIPLEENAIFSYLPSPTLG